MSDAARAFPDAPEPGFTPGFASRHDRAGEALRKAFAPVEGFSAIDIRDRIRDARPKPAADGPVGFSPQSRHTGTADAAQPGPRHFSPADPEERTQASAAPGANDSDFHDPFEAARTAGYAEGLAAARTEMAQAQHREEALVTRLSEALAQGSHFDRERVARQLRQTVLALVQKIIGETGIAPDYLANRVEVAADMLSDSAESAMLRLNPDDLAMVEDKLPKTVFPVGDPHVERGHFVIESASTVIEDGPDLWIEQLTAALEHVTPPSC
ncbi:hypothetical protein GCM10023219_13050 [Stakelama sediminis]|uniref:Flagellar assembly protein FliH n=1 Tax=Stakelama sediminis TaxID=463200 RepID=A0A840YWD3_9SPHN|nr:FliH/SctL family protein [Stakelama sediminis]MBB5718031.1 flagellar assembly protein FliH [Stakelama sediminis]